MRCQISFGGLLDPGSGGGSARSGSWEFWAWVAAGVSGGVFPARELVGDTALVQAAKKSAEIANSRQALRIMNEIASRNRLNILITRFYRAYIVNEFTAWHTLRGSFFLG